MAAKPRAGGALDSARCVQLKPSHSHVSANIPPASTPPNSTARPRLLSNAMAWPQRPLGRTGVLQGNHSRPLCSHVSASAALPPS
jgi:hypothetical protein